MLRSLRTWLPGLLVVCAAPVLCAQETADRYALPPTVSSDQSRTPFVPSREERPAAPPAWQDGASVYLTSHDGSAKPASEHGDETRMQDDAQVTPAAYQHEYAREPEEFPDERRLVPLRDANQSNARDESAAASGLPHWGLPMDSLYTTLTALALVVGLLLLCTWAVRRGSRGSTAILSDEVVSVLGHTPLAGRQVAQLLRVGNKLVLISVTPSGAQTLAEVTDPTEVERLLDLCLQRSPHRTTADFDKTFRRLSREKSTHRKLGEEAAVAAAPSVADLFRAYQGEPERA